MTTDAPGRAAVKFAACLGLVVFVAYAGFVGWLYLNQRRMIFIPDTHRITPAQAGIPSMTTVTARTEDGLNLTGWYQAAPTAGAPVVLFFHGSGGNLWYNRATARGFVGHGYGLLMAEYRGYGGNPGTPTEMNFDQDARAWMRFLREGQHIDAARIVIAGQSLGTGVAVKTANENPDARALILLSPYTTLPAVAASTYWYIPLGFLMRDKFDNLGRIRSVRMPLLILHGERDDVIPIALGRAVYDAAPGPKEFAAFPQAGHFDLYDHGAFQRMTDFIDRHANDADPKERIPRP